MHLARLGQTYHGDYVPQDAVHVALTKDLLASMEAKSLPDGPTILAISLGNDDAAEALAESIGAVKLLDKIHLVEEFVPAILGLL